MGIGPFDANHVSSRRFRRPGLENLEGRALLASHPLGPALPGRHYPAAHVRQYVPLLFPQGAPQPTPQEVSRESFVDKAIGTYTVGPGRFADQALTIKGGGKSSTSNMSQRDRFQFIILVPKDPTQPVVGAVNYIPANFLNSGGSIILDFNSPVGAEAHGLPTRLNWVHDGASGVPFVGAGTSPLFSTVPTIVDFNLGAGQTTFKFIPSRHPLPGTFGSGQVVLVSRGLLNVAPNNPIDKNYN